MRYLALAEMATSNGAIVCFLSGWGEVGLYFMFAFAGVTVGGVLAKLDERRGL